MVYLRILGQYLLVAAVALTINFALPRLAPGGPLEYLLGAGDIAALSEAERARVLAEFGLDKPLPAQFLDYLAGILRGDLGVSVQSGQPVWDVVMQRLPWTLLLMGGALVVSGVLGVGLGVAVARVRGGRADALTLGAVLFAGSMPSFWVAMILITVFSATLGWLPSFGAYPLAAAPGGWDWWVGVAQRLVMPVTALGLVHTANLLLTARSAMIMALDQDHIAFARAKGVPEGRVFVRHALRNAMLPIYTNLMTSVGALVGGALVVETVFAYPGLGSLILQSVLARDYNLLQAVFLLATASVILANLIAELGYPFLDPRVRRAG